MSVLPTQGPRFTEAQTLGVAGTFAKSGAASDLHRTMEAALNGLTPPGGLRRWLRWSPHLPGRAPKAPG
jgi:hypothetical protein